MAETLLLKQQLIVLRRGRRRAPNLTLSDRLLCGFGSLFLSPGRIRKLAIVARPSTLLAFHAALVRRKYRRLFSSRPRPKKPGPKGPSAALIQAIVELKSRNPQFGCPRIAHILTRTFGVDVDKNVVSRVLAKHYRPRSGGNGPSWLSFIGHTTNSPLERGPLSMRVHRAPELLGARGDGSVCASPRSDRVSKAAPQAASEFPTVEAPVCSVHMLSPCHAAFLAGISNVGLIRFRGHFPKGG